MPAKVTTLCKIYKLQETITNFQMKTMRIIEIQANDSVATVNGSNMNRLLGLGGFSLRDVFLKTINNDSEPCIGPWPTCPDPKINIQYREFCIPRVLLNEYQNYQQFRMTRDGEYSKVATENLFGDLEYFVFFCQTMRLQRFCEHLANLCALSLYNLDKYSPCNLFFSSQATGAGSSSLMEKVKPFIFFTKGKSATDELERIIDNRYRYDPNDDGDDDDEFNGMYGQDMMGVSFGKGKQIPDFPGNFQKI